MNRSIALALALHAAIVALASAGRQAWWLALPAVLVIAGLQHHLLTLAHEAAHGLLHRRRRWNDLLGDVLGAVPFFTTVAEYRAYHVRHHRFAGTPEDPELAYYASQVGRGWRLALADVFLVNWLLTARFYARTLAELRRRGELARRSGRDALVFLAFWGPVAAIAALGFWREVLAFWFAPQLVLFPLTKLRAYGEHAASGARERSFSNEHSWLGRFFLAPLNSGHHLEHHLDPGVPWYEIPRLRERLGVRSRGIGLAARVRARWRRMPPRGGLGGRSPPKSAVDSGRARARPR